MKNNIIYPVITLYQPWATWIIRGWKTIETRTHNRFSCLAGKDILIHAGKLTDSEAAINPYLSLEQIKFRPEDVVNSAILGIVHVYKSSVCDPADSNDALIDCTYITRFGLFLQIEKIFDPIHVKGERGIWYYNLSTHSKSSKNEYDFFESKGLSSQLTLFH